MDRSITAVGVMLGIAIGLPAGIALAVARRAWKDFTATKNSLPGLRTAAWQGTRATAGRFVFLAILVGAAIGWAAFGSR